MKRLVGSTAARGVARLCVSRGAVIGTGFRIDDRTRRVCGVPARAAQPCWSGPSPAQTTSPAEHTHRREHRTGADDRIRVAGGEEPPHDRRQHAQAAAESQEEHPPRARVASGPEGVKQRNRPGRVGEPVDCPPSTRPYPPPEEAGGDERQQQVERDCPDPEPERPVRRQERDERVDDADRREGVDDRRQDMHDGEREREQRDVPMQAVDDESRPAVGLPACRVRDAEQRPMRSGGAAPRLRSPVSGTRAPCRCSRRRGPGSRGSLERPLADPRTPSRSRRRVSPAARGRVARPGACSPRTRAAVLAALASTHVAAATVTVRQCVTAGRPVRGSRMW